jgi:hypothetical protein
MLRNINNELIHISQPEYVSTNRIHFELKYNNKTGILIQTPLSTIYDINNQMQIGFPNYDYNPDVNKFISLIEQIDNYIISIQKELWKKIGKNTRDKKYFTSIKWNHNRSNCYMRLSLQKELTRNKDNIVETRTYLDVYDQNKEKKTINYIEPFSTGYHIIYCNNIWVSLNDKSMGLQWYVIQSKIYKNILKFTDCLIQDDEYDQSFIKPEIHCTCCSKKQILSTNPEEHPTLGRFIKMKRMGIPIDAIRLKIEQENLSFIEFESLLNNIPKAPTIPSITQSMPSGRPAISANMLTGITLKKATVNTNEMKKEIIPLQLKEKYTPPSADEIKTILARLKKTN